MRLLFAEFGLSHSFVLFSLFFVTTLLPLKYPPEEHSLACPCLVALNAINVCFPKPGLLPSLLSADRTCGPHTLISPG